MPSGARTAVTTAAVSSSGEKSSSPIALMPARAARPSRTCRSNAASSPSSRIRPSATSRLRISDTAGVNAASSLSCAFLLRAPVEVEAARRLRTREHLLRHRDHREPGRAHQRLLRARDDDVDPPRVGLERDGAERRDRVDDERRVADRLLDRAHVGDDAGRGVGLLAEHELDARLAHGGADLVRIRRLAPLVADRLHLDAVLLADRDPALAEGAVADDRDAVAGRAQVRDGRLHRARCRTP